jgi:ATP-dependent DNA helicase RecG
MEHAHQKHDDTWAALGLDRPWAPALYLPVRWEDNRQVIERFSHIEAPANTRIVAIGAVESFHFEPVRPFRVNGRLRDSAGARLGFTAFGRLRELQAELKEAAGQLVWLAGTLTRFDSGRVWLSQAETLPDEAIGRLWPRYTSDPEFDDRLHRALRPSIDPAVSHLRAQLAEHQGKVDTLLAKLGFPKIPIERVLMQAHWPRTPSGGAKAQEAIERLAAWLTLAKARANAKPDGPPNFPPRQLDWEARAQAISFKLTAEQRCAVSEILAAIQSGRLLRWMLAGDVGTGKTAVFALVAAAVADAGGRVAIMLPSQPLAAQVAGQIAGWWPDLKPRLLAAQGDSGGDTKQNAPIWVGTTALLHTDLGRLDLIVIDEQQKFSRAQREEAFGKSNVTAHRLEASATCIPRSQALIQCGALGLSRLTTPHVKKDIRTRIWSREQAGRLFAEIRATLTGTNQLLVLYPKRGRRRQAAQLGKDDAEAALDLWEQHFPGAVRIVHGALDAETNTAALADMAAGRAKILVATTAVEVGIDLPDLRRVLIVHAERFGLTTLHQIRGRVARTGGCGYCDLYLPKSVSEKAEARLRVMTETSDGFEIAKRDLALRGMGELGGDAQSGADATVLIDRALKQEHLEAWLDAESQRSQTALARPDCCEKMEAVFLQTKTNQIGDKPAARNQSCVASTR